MQNISTSKDRQWFPTIDGLRAIAIICVLFSHTPVPLPRMAWGWALGNFGVALFFAISGFLAYFVLHRDEERLGRVDYNYFLLRRVLRIWPAYFAVILAAYFLSSKDAITNATFLSLFTFTINWDMANFTGWPLPPISLLWSISVEEQFYVLAPFMYRLLRSRYALIFALSVIALSNIGRLLYITSNFSQSGNGGLYYLTYTYADIFLAGALVAHWFLKGGRIGRWSQWAAFLFSLMLIDISMNMWRPVLFPPYTPDTLLPYMLLPLALGLLFVSVMPMRQTAFSWLLSTTPLSIVAKLSYSLYLVHLLVGNYVTSGLLPLYSAFLVTAALLYVIIERPFLRQKQKARAFIGKWPWPAIITWGALVTGFVRYWVNNGI